ncbi:MAG TPA: isoprenylcysteine carboxylmethyltransferase family protein [Candidatus Polarisedimenticolia bacterium]|nr:isoprenylcysteine carboxylmethyltransferase family protein [Candidatus Polarisedimenticolia bacterium]
MKRLMVAAGNFFFHWREMLFPAVQVVLVFGFTPRPWPGGAAGTGLDLGDALGLLLILLGQGLRAAVIGFAYIKRGGQNRRIHADDLVTDGLFAHCRNPLYVGNVLILSGLFFVHGSPWVIGLGIGFFVFAYIAITLAEEQFLAGRFGDAYAAYCARVPRFLPDLRGLGRTLEGMSFDWAKVVRKEYGATFAWVTMLVLILTLESRAQLDPAAFKARLVLLAGVWGIALLGYATARALKKRGSLGGHARRAAS